MEKDTPQPTHPQAWFLPSLLEVARTAGLRPAVTLSVGGILIAGELVDQKTYFDELAVEIDETLTGVLTPDAAAQLKQLLARFGTGQPPSAAGEPDHIHLRIAKVYHPSGSPMPANGGAYWRVRLSAIDGFSLDMPPAGAQAAA
jgi:hypothetical protein